MIFINCSQNIWLRRVEVCWLRLAFRLSQTVNETNTIRIKRVQVVSEKDCGLPMNAQILLCLQFGHILWRKERVLTKLFLLGLVDKQPIDVCTGHLVRKHVVLIQEVEWIIDASPQRQQ